MLIGSAFAPVGSESPGSLFAAAAGYPVASSEQSKILDLKEAPAGWAPLDAEVAAALGDYRVTVFDERVPDEYIDDFCALLSAFIGRCRPATSISRRRRGRPSGCATTSAGRSRSAGSG